MAPKRRGLRSDPHSEGESSGTQNDALIEAMRVNQETLSRQMVEMQAQVQAVLAATLAQQPRERDPVVGQTGSGSAANNAPVSGEAQGTVVAPLVPPALLPPEMNFISHFQRLGPPSYDGKADFMVLDDWLIAIEEMFFYSKISADQKVMIAAYQLKGLAKSWWIREREGLDGGCSWEQFKEMLRMKFLPSVEQDRLMNAFLYLKQRSLSVGEYEVEFSKLSRFAPDLVNTEERRIKRFIGGLRSDIQQLAIAFKAHSFAEVVEAALRVEAVENARIQSMKWAKGKRKVEDVGPSRSSNPSPKKERKERCAYCRRPGHSIESCFKRLGVSKPPLVHAIQSVPRGEISCSWCKRRGHDVADCWLKDKVCFQCGQKGHTKAKCTQTLSLPPVVPLPALPPPPLDKGRGKLNVLTEEEAQTSFQVISGSS